MAGHGDLLGWRRVRERDQVAGRAVAVATLGLPASTALAVPLRDRYNAFIERHEVAWELSMGVLALVWVALGFLADEVGPDVAPEVEAVELLLTGVFIVEFATRLAAAHDRRQYLRGHWIDAVALAPPVRAFRLLRLLRLLRLVRAFAGFYRAAMHVRGLASHRGFAWLLVSWMTVMAICSAFVYGAEHGINKLFENPFDALWWGVVTLTTVGYGDTVPVTPEGRAAAMILMLLGVGLFSAVTATITSYFITQDQKGTTTGHALVDTLATLAELREQGSLTEEEFTLAKARVLASEAPAAATATAR
jgi:voltage-gated potassium channel